MTAILIDASAGAEIVTDTRRGRALARLIPPGAEGWVPEHFYAEVLAVLRRRMLIEKTITEAQAAAAVDRLRSWRLRKASVAPLVQAAWVYRHNMTAADALYVVLAEHLDADFLTDDHNLVDGPTFPRTVNVLRIPSGRFSRWRISQVSRSSETSAEHRSACCRVKAVPSLCLSAEGEI